MNLRHTLAACIATATAVAAFPLASHYVEASRYPTLGPSTLVVLPEAVRLIDTRNGDTLPHTITAGDRPVWANVAIVNVAVVEPDAAGYVTFWNCAGDAPEVAHLNYNAGGVTSGMAYAPLGAGGTMCATSSGGGDVVIDVQAWTVAAQMYDL